MRIVYFISSYRPHGEAVRLAHALRGLDPDGHIVVHHDRFRSPCPTFPEELGVHVLVSDAPIEWGGSSLVAARVRVLRWCAQRLTYDWVVTLSEQDYPIQPLDDLHDFLAGTSADAFIAAAPEEDLSPEVRRTADRNIGFHYVGVRPRAFPSALPSPLRTKVTGALRRLATSVQRPASPVRIIPAPGDVEAPVRIGLRRRRTPLAPHEQLWFGDAWFALSSRAVDALLTSLRERPDLWRFYRSAFAPEESIFATIVGSHPELRVTRHALHLVRWRAGSAHPAVLELRDLGSFSGSDRFFARKFDHVRSRELLDALDRDLRRP